MAEDEENQLDDLIAQGRQHEINKKKEIVAMGLTHKQNGDGEFVVKHNFIRAT